MLQGHRGLPGHCSLAQLLAEKRGVRNIQTLPTLTIKQILKWADAHHKKYGRWPNINSGVVLDEPGESWLAINGSLSKGRRNLPGGSSLAQLLAEKREFRNRADLLNLTKGQILKWTDVHYKTTGQWPNRKSGALLGAAGEKWPNIDAALKAGRRGLPAGSSLAQLLTE